MLTPLRTADNIILLLKSSIDKIDSDNKKCTSDKRELREQKSALQTGLGSAQPSSVANENVYDLLAPHVTFVAILTVNEQPLVENIIPLSTYSTPPSSAAGVQSLGENVSAQRPLPNHSTPYPTSVGEDTLPVSTIRRQNSIYGEDMRTKILFMVSFNDKSLEFGYNNRQNLRRLQKALQGDARQAVASLLLYPDNLPQVMMELRFNFGRPEILVRSQWQQLPQVSPVTETNANGVINLSNKVRNIVALFKAANCKEQLMNPILLEQLLAKLPRSKQFEWAKHASTIKSYVTIEHFSNWLSELAKIVCFMPVAPTVRQGVNSSSAIDQIRSNPRRMLHTSYAKNCMCCKGDHMVPVLSHSILTKNGVKSNSIDCAYHI